MRIRQLVFVAKERDELAQKICDLFELKETFNDPGIIHFGLENVLIPLNDTFIEIVTPVQENTTAERFLDKRGGDGGYMVILDVDDFEAEKKRVENENISIVWNADRKEEDIHARAIHLHPKETGGAILSLDKMIPEDAWLWAGTNWRKDISTSLVDCLTGVILQSDDPDNLCSKWEKALGKTKSSNEVAIELNSSKISFLKQIKKLSKDVLNLNKIGNLIFVKGMKSLSRKVAVSVDGMTIEVEGVPVAADQYQVNKYISPTQYAENQTIEFNGVRTQIKGQPVDSDFFTLSPSTSTSVFATMQRAIDTLRLPGTTDKEEAVRLTQFSMAQLELDTALDRIVNTRSRVGSRMQTLTNQNEIGQDFKLVAQSSMSKLEDLDMAQAISDLKLQQTALEVAQTTFVQLERLSLFDLLR